MKACIFNVGLVAIIIVVVVAIAAVSACQFVDTTQAKFERGQMIEFKAGGIGQVVRRTGKNEGMPWNLMPVFRYEVRRENGWKIWYSEWEMANHPIEALEIEMRVINYICPVCSQETLDDYMLTQETWGEAGFTQYDNAHMLCVAKRLGRPLCRDDFIDALVNRVYRDYIEGTEMVQGYTVEGRIPNGCWFLIGVFEDKNAAQDYVEVSMEENGLRVRPIPLILRPR